MQTMPTPTGRHITQRLASGPTMFDKTPVLEKLVHFARLSRATHNWDIYMYRPDKVGPDGAPHNVAPGLGLHLLLN